jgi:hypothetical protein
MAKRKNEDEKTVEGLQVDEPRVGVGPHDNISPAQVAQAKLDVERGIAPVSPVPGVKAPVVEEPTNVTEL